MPLPTGVRRRGECFPLDSGLRRNDEGAAFPLENLRTEPRYPFDFAESTFFIPSPRESYS